MRPFLVFAVIASVASGSPAQQQRLQFGSLPANLLADFTGVFWSPGGAADRVYVLAPFGGLPQGRCEFSMFRWNGHPMMQSLYPGGWVEVQFWFQQWAYLSAAPCALQGVPGQLLPHGGIDSTYDYGPPLCTGPVVGVNTPLPGWALGNSAVPVVRGNPGSATDETFALFTTDYWHSPLNACQGATPIDWVAVEIRFEIVLR